MSGNYHVRFLGGKEAVKPLTYPVLPYLRQRKDTAGRTETTSCGFGEIGQNHYEIFSDYIFHFRIFNICKTKE